MELWAKALNFQVAQAMHRWHSCKPKLESKSVPSCYGLATFESFLSKKKTLWYVEMSCCEIEIKWKYLYKYGKIVSWYEFWFELGVDSMFIVIFFWSCLKNMQI